MSSHLSMDDEAAASQAPSDSFSPRRILATLALLIYGAEIVAMAVLYVAAIPDYLLASLLDGLIMLSLIVPGLYLLQLKPLTKQIEQRNRAERALRANEQLLQKVLEVLPVGVWILDKAGKIIHGNPASRRLWAGGRYVGIEDYGEYRGWWADTGEPIAPNDWAGARAVTLGETSLEEEVQIECFNGSRKFIFNSAVPIHDEQGAVRGAVVVNQDITENRQAQQALIESNELMERFFSSIGVLIAYMDRDFNFIRVNEAYAGAAGHPPDFFRGKNHFELYPHAENESLFKHVVDTGKPISVLHKPFEYQEYPERGVTYWDWSLQPVKGPEGYVQGVVLSLIDVTERVRAETQLTQRHKELLVLSQSEHRQRELAEGLTRSVIALGSSLQPEEVLNTILEQIQRAVPFTCADLVLVDAGGLRIATSRGFPAVPGSAAGVPEAYALAELPLVRQICATLQPLLISDTAQDGQWQATAGTDWVRSYLGAPLLRNGRVTGVISLTCDQRGGFDQQTLASLMAFAAPAELALHNAQLYEAESNARQAAETLSTAAQALTRTLELDQVISTLVEHVNTVVAADLTAIALFEGETRLVMRSVLGQGQGLNTDQILSIVVDTNTSPIVQTLLSTRKSMIIADTATSPEWQHFPGTEQLRSWLGVPLVAGDKVIGVVGLGKTRPGGFTHEQCQWAEVLVGQAAMAVQNAWLFEQVRASSERLQRLSHRLVEVQENERRYIASELHDEVGQALTALMVGLQLIENKAAEPDAVRAEVVEMGHVLDTVIDNLHRLAMDLRPASLDFLGLEAALSQHVETMRERLGLKIEFGMTGVAGRLPANVEIAFYRIVQEALNNVARHARATHVDVLITQRADCLALIIEDDGIGFIPAEAAHGKRMGLSGMRERAEMLGGKLVIESLPGKGSTVLVEVPYADTNSHRG